MDSLKRSKMCIECKKNVVLFHLSYFCEDCIRDFFGKSDSVSTKEKEVRNCGYKSIVRNTKKTEKSYS